MMQRRTFFQLLAGAMLASVPALNGEVMPDYMLWGDGIHDDAPALNALIRGEVVEFGPLVSADGAGWVLPKVLRIPNGRYLVLSSLIFDAMDGVTIDLCMSRLVTGPDDYPVFWLKHCYNCYVSVGLYPDESARSALRTRHSPGAYVRNRPRNDITPALMRAGE